MLPTVALRRDHEVLRDKLDRLERHLPDVQSFPRTAGAFVDGVAEALRVHTEREEAWLSEAITRADHTRQATLQRLLDAHQNHRIRLAILHELLAGHVTPAASETIIVQAGCLIHGLRAHLAEEERTLYPWVDVAGSPQHELELQEAQGSVGGGA